MEQKNIMQYESVLPENFDGTFRFTNWSDEDFIGKYDSKEYRFPAGTTSPILMANHTPLEIQSIRKKFAKDLAEREFFKSKQYENLRIREGTKDDLGMIQPRGYGMSHAGTYSLESLSPFIQRCLEPLSVSRAVVTEVQQIPLEEKLSRDNSGELNSIVVEQNGDLIETKKSLRKKALE